MPPAQRTVRCAGPANLLGSPLGSTSVVGAVIARSTKNGAFEGRSTSLSLIRSHATRRLSFFCSLWGRLLHGGQCLEFSTESSRRLGRSLTGFWLFTMISCVSLICSPCGRSRLSLYCRSSQRKYSSGKTSTARSLYICCLVVGFLT